MDNGLPAFQEEYWIIMYRILSTMIFTRHLHSPDLIDNGLQMDSSKVKGLPALPEYLWMTVGPSLHDSPD